MALWKTKSDWLITVICAQIVLYNEKTPVDPLRMPYMDGMLIRLHYLNLAGSGMVMGKSGCNEIK